MSEADQRRPGPPVSSLSPKPENSAEGERVRGRRGAEREHRQSSEPPSDRGAGGADEPTVLRPAMGRAERLRLRRKAIEDASGTEETSDRQEVSERVPSSFVARARPQPVEPSSSIEQFLLPQRSTKRSFGTILSFVLCVLLPMALASVYFIFIASDQYVVEFRFSVRELSQSPASAPGGASIASILGVSASASNPSDNFMVTDYLTSRQIVDELQSKIKIRDLYSKSTIDWWARFNPSKPMEKFLSYWQDMAKASYDPMTGIAIAQVRAFSASDAFLIANSMVSQAENLVNQVSMRPRLDAVKFAEAEVNRSEERIRDLRSKLSQYRNKESVIDPNSNVVTSNTTLAQSLRSQLMQYETELTMLTSRKLSPTAPYIVTLKSRIDAARKQLALVESQIATSKDGERPLSAVVGEYEKLNLDLTFAQTILTGAVQSLEQARMSAMSQQLYITPYVRPALPQTSTYPNRPVSILLITLGCFFAWTIGLLIVRSIREHLA